MNSTIDIFLKSLEKAHKENMLHFVSRWESIRNEKFPAYTKFTLEVVELNKGVSTQRFIVQRTQNMTEFHNVLKEEAIKIIKDNITEEMITIMLKYYMYGELVQ